MEINLEFKKALFEKVLSIQTEKLQTYVAEIRANRENLGSATKSSAGDKHETGRAMLQLEQEKLGKSYSEAEKIRQLLLRVTIDKRHPQIAVGCLFKTTQGLFLLAASFGKIRFENQDVFVLGPSAPLSQALLGKRVGDDIEFQGKRISISATV
jgi:hypothetical protein